MQTVLLESIVCICTCVCESIFVFVFERGYTYSHTETFTFMRVYVRVQRGRLSVYVQWNRERHIQRETHSTLP